jgi:osmoprotectant transport system ATP-binding protein
MRSDESAAGESIPAAATLRQALSRMVSEGRDRLPVTDAAGRPSGAIYLADLLRR